MDEYRGDRSAWLQYSPAKEKLASPKERATSPARRKAEEGGWVVGHKRESARGDIWGSWKE
jgi:hypothetical protein